MLAQSPRSHRQMRHAETCRLTQRDPTRSYFFFGQRSHGIWRADHHLPSTAGCGLSPFSSAIVSDQQRPPSGEAELWINGAMLCGSIVDDSGDIKGVRCGGFLFIAKISTKTPLLRCERSADAQESIPLETNHTRLAAVSRVDST